jgi:hypothetical protein
VSAVSFTSDARSFIIDTGASITISNDILDFKQPLRPVRPTTLKGIASGLTVEGIGTAVYTFTADDGSLINLSLDNVLFIPACPVRLLCPRHVAENTASPMDGFTSHHDHGILTIHNKRITVPYNEHTGLPLIFTASGCSRYQVFLPTAMQTSDPTLCIKGNSTPSQRVKLILHERCNHVNMKQLNRWIRQGSLKVDKAIANSPDPICIACQFGKGQKGLHLSPMGPITDDITGPGQSVSADKMEAAYPGRIPTTRGLPSPKRYKSVNIWVDNYTKYIYPTFHETKDLASMLFSKKEFEAFAAKHGVTIQAIRADNGVYTSGGFQADCDAKCQRLTFCAVGGHCQNGVAERRIGHITRTARTLLLHAMASWPGTITEEFWPFAVRHACTFHNVSIHNDTNKSPHHMFTGSPAP